MKYSHLSIVANIHSLYIYYCVNFSMSKLTPNPILRVAELAQHFLSHLCSHQRYFQGVSCDIKCFVQKTKVLIDVKQHNKRKSKAGYDVTVQYHQRERPLLRLAVSQRPSVTTAQKSKWSSTVDLRAQRPGVQNVKK